MPPYQASFIGRNVQQLVPGLSCYLFGSLNRDVAPTRMTVTQVQLTSPTAQVTGIVIEGQIPVVGQLVSIQGAVPAYFNVTNAKITAVTAAATPDVGLYTISFALTNANIATTNSPGLAIAPQAEVGDAVSAVSNTTAGVAAVLAGFASCAAALQSNVNPSQQRAIRFDVSFPTAAGSLTVVAQSASLDIDSEYQDMGTVATLTGGVLAGGSVIFSNYTANFVRLITRTPVGIGAAKIVGKVTI